MNFLRKSFLHAALLGSLVLPAITQAEDLTLRNLIEVATPIESTTQGCLSHLSYYELTQDERKRMVFVSMQLHDLVTRFAKEHSVAAYHDVIMAYMQRMAEVNQTRPVVVCDSALVKNLEERAQKIEDEYKSIKGPRERG